jgi:hypothetical protein
MTLKIKVVDPEILADAIADNPGVSSDELEHELSKNPENMIEQNV